MNAPLRVPTSTRTPLMPYSFRDVTDEGRRTIYAFPGARNTSGL